MELKQIIEAILFANPQPLSVKEIRTILKTAAEQNPENQTATQAANASEEEIQKTLESLASEYAAAGHAYTLKCVADAWQFVTLPDFGPWLRAALGIKIRPPRLSQAALETLAIIAYRQPITRAEVEEIRGVNVDAVMQTLLERKLIQIVGRADLPGKPPLYGTTREFLEYFGLRSLDDLPGANQLRKPTRQIVSQPESDATNEAPKEAGGTTPTELPSQTLPEAMALNIAPPTESQPTAENSPANQEENQNNPTSLNVS